MTLELIISHPASEKGWWNKENLLKNTRVPFKIQCILWLLLKRLRLIWQILYLKNILYCLFHLKVKIDFV